MQANDKLTLMPNSVDVLVDVLILGNTSAQVAEPLQIFSYSYFQLGLLGGSVRSNGFVWSVCFVGNMQLTTHDTKFCVVNCSLANCEPCGACL